MSTMSAAGSSKKRKSPAQGVPSPKVEGEIDMSTFNFDSSTLELDDFSDDEKTVTIKASQKSKIDAQALPSVEEDATEEPSVKKAKTLDETAEKKKANQQAQSERSTKLNQQRGISSDPSLRYFNQPGETPTVTDALDFFEYQLPATAFQKGPAKLSKKAENAEVKPKNPIKFNVTVGPTTKWRTLAKLAVRTFGPKTTEDLIREKVSATFQARFKTQNGTKWESASAEDKESLKARIEDEVTRQLESSKTNDDLPPMKLSRNQRKALKKANAGEELWERPQIGLFSPGTHDIVPGIELCPAHHPSINTAINEISQVINNLKVTGFNDKTGAGQLRFIAMTVATNPAVPGPITLDGQRNDEPVEAATKGKVQLTLVWNSIGSNADKPKSFDTPAIEEKLPQGAAAFDHFEKNDKTLGAFIKTLLQDRRVIKKRDNGAQKPKKEKKEKKPLVPENHWLWQSIHVHYQNSWSHTNAIFSHDPNSWQHIFGPAAITENMIMNYPKPSPPKAASTEEKKDVKYPIMPFPSPANPVLHFPPTVFRQANLEGFSKIVKSVRNWVPNGSRVVELYGGVGTIGLNIVDKVEYVICSDENPNNARCFLAATSSLPLALRAGRAIKYIPKNAIDMVKLGAIHKSVLTKADLFLSEEQLRKEQQALESDSDDDEDENAMNDKEKNKEKEITPVEESAESFNQLVLKLNTMGGESLLPPNVCIVDPPRKGLEPEILQALAAPKAPKVTSKTETNGLKVSGGKNASRVQSESMETKSHLDRLIYVSCGFKALKRDAEQLTSQEGGGWKIAHAEGHILFPGADHLETLVVFVR